jgi:hypothetical protein
MNSPYLQLTGNKQFSNMKRHLRSFVQIFLQLTCSKVCRKAEAIIKAHLFLSKKLLEVIASIVDFLAQSGDKHQNS